MNFSWLKQLLDRPITRGLLRFLVDRKAKNIWGPSAAITYDDCWLHSFDGLTIAETRPRTFLHPPRVLDAHRNWWFANYEGKDGDIIIDVGAGIGAECILFSEAVGPNGRVLAIEAHPNTFTCLAKTCTYNNLRNVALFNIAISNVAKTVYIEDSEQHISNRIYKNRKAGRPVDATTIDKLLADLAISRVALLKMNIEGAERDAIVGMTESIRNIAKVVIACHDFKADKTGDDFFRTRGEITEFLVSNEFEIISVPHRHPWDRDHVHAVNSRFSNK